MFKVACKSLPQTTIFFPLMVIRIKPGTSALVIKTNNRRTFYEITKKTRGKSFKQNNKKERILPIDSRHVLLQPPQAFKSGEWLFFSCSHFSTTSLPNASNRLVLFPVCRLTRFYGVLEIPLTGERMGTSCKRNDL